MLSPNHTIFAFGVLVPDHLGEAVQVVIYHCCGSSMSATALLERILALATHFVGVNRRFPAAPSAFRRPRFS